MTAIILAAGMGTRLWPLTKTMPKALLPVGGTPILGRAIDSLSSVGIHDIAIVTGYLHEQIEDFVRNFTGMSSVKFIRNDNYAHTGNNYSLWLGLNPLRSQKVLVLDADIVFDRGILSDVLQSPHPDALVIRRTADLGQEEVKVECDAAGVVVRIGKDIELAKAVGESLGIEKFSPSTSERLYATLTQRRAQPEFYEASFQEMVSNGVIIATVDAGQQACVEIDTQDDLREAERLFGSLAL